MICVTADTVLQVYTLRAMSTAPRRIVTGHDASGKSVVLSAVRTPPPAGGVTVRFTEMAPGAEAPMVFVMIDGAITDELRATTGPLQFFDQVLG